MKKNIITTAFSWTLWVKQPFFFFFLPQSSSWPSYTFTFVFHNSFTLLLLQYYIHLSLVICYFFFFIFSTYLFITVRQAGKIGPKTLRRPRTQDLIRTQDLMRAQDLWETSTLWRLRNLWWHHACKLVEIAIEDRFIYHCWMQVSFVKPRENSHEYYFSLSENRYFNC